MKNLTKYLESKAINYKVLNDLVIEISGKTYELLQPDEDGVIFDEAFTMIIPQATDEDNYVFYFGEKWYWSPKGTEHDPQLNPLLYLGEASVEFCENETFLGVRGAYEILNGSRVYEDWVNKAKFLGVKHLGICEKNTLAGVLKFQYACKNAGIKPIIGATYTVYRSVDGEQLNYQVKCYPKNKSGWENLLLINKEINVVNQKFIKEADFISLSSNLFVVLDTKTIAFDKVFPLDLSIEDLYYSFDTVQFKDLERDEWMLYNLKAFYKSELKPLPFSDAFYLEQEDNGVKKFLNGISGVHDYISENQYFKSKDQYLEEVSSLFGKDEVMLSFIDKMLENEKLLVEKINFEIETGERHLPRYELTPEESKLYSSPLDMFLGLIDEGLSKKVENGTIPEEKLEEYLNRADTESEVIQYGDVVDYFLILRDIINWAKANNILVGTGRGSCGGSLVGWLLDIHSVDPIKYGLIFERFLNKGRIGTRTPETMVIIETDEGQKKVWGDSMIEIIRGGKQGKIEARKLKITDEIIEL